MKAGVLPMVWLVGMMPIAIFAADPRTGLSEVLRSKADAARGGELFAQCIACHGADGNGETRGSTPRIAGQHYRVIAKQLVDFRSGRRWDFRMEGMADDHHLETAQDIADVAVYVAGLSRSGNPGIGSGEFAEEGSRLFAARCQPCHGADADGDPSKGIPRLAGQHYSYLLRQMYDAVDGRRLTLPRLHSQRIEPLDFEQVRAVADYLARLGWSAPKIPGSN